MCLQDSMQKLPKGLYWRNGRSFGVRIKEHRKEVEQQEGRKYTRSTKRQSQSEHSRTNRLSQTTSTQKITSSTATRQQSLPVSLTGLHGGSGRLSRSVRKAKVL